MPNQFRPDLVGPPFSLSPQLRFGCVSVRKFYWGLRDTFTKVRIWQCASDRTSCIGGAATHVRPKTVKSCVIPWRDISRSKCPVKSMHEVTASRLLLAGLVSQSHLLAIPVLFVRHWLNDKCLCNRFLYSFFLLHECHQVSCLPSYFC